VILAVLCGAEIAGIPGIFLSVPAAGIVSVVLRYVGGTESIVADILQPAAPPSTSVTLTKPPPQDPDEGS
jgi:predicted PurR-regulated permease PerM